MIERIVFLSALLAGSVFFPYMTAQTGGSEVEACATVTCQENQKAQAQRHQMRQETANQETDNKVREMANETYVNRVKTSDKLQ